MISLKNTLTPNLFDYAQALATYSLCCILWASFLLR